MTYDPFEEARLSPEKRAMIRKGELRAAIRSWMEKVLQSGKFASAREWAKAAGVNPSAVQRPLSEDYGYVVSTKTLNALAEAAGQPAPTFADVPWGDNVRPLPILHEVAAGGFHRRDELRQTPLGRARVVLVPLVDHRDQWLERVVSDSMDRKIPVGSLVHVVSAIATRYSPRTGDIVIVERRAAQGSMVERTVKEVEVLPGGVQLWPRSHNPAYQRPVELMDGANHADDTTEVEIVGKVVRAYVELSDDLETYEPTTA